MAPGRFANPPISRAASGGLLATLMGLYVAMHLIPAAELIMVLTGVNLRLTVILGVVLTLGVMLSGQFGRFFTLPAAKYWFALVGIEFVAALAGDYPGRSLPFIAQYALRFHLFPVLICAVAQTSGQLRRLFYWGAATAGILVVLTAVLGQTAEGRLYIPDTSLGNPNDLALVLLILGIFLSSLFFSNNTFARLLPIPLLPVMAYFVLQTGSRANFITLCLLLVAALIFAPKRARIGVLLLSPILAGVLFVAVPPETRQRLVTIVSNPVSRLVGGGGTDQERAAIASQYARTRLQEHALELTARHPVLGVGPLMFADAVDEMVREEEGQKSGWQFAHNVYLQIAAENGVAAFLLFAGSIVWILGTNFKLFRASRHDPRFSACNRHALLLLLLSICFSFGIAFGNYIYDPVLPVIFGATAANLLSFQAAQRVRPEPQPAA